MRCWLKCIRTNVLDCNCSTECEQKDSCEELFEKLCRCFCSRNGYWDDCCD